VTFRDDRPQFSQRGGGRNAFRRGQCRGNRRGRQNAMYGPQYIGQRAAYDMQYDGRTMTYTGPTTYFNQGQNLAQQAGGRQNEQCWKCGRRRHERLNLCPAINHQCFICNRIGHFAKVCRSTARADQATSDLYNAPLCAEGAGETGRTGHCSVSVQQPIENGNFISLSINGKHQNVLLNTGASVSLIHEDTLRSLKLKLHPLSQGQPKLLISVSK